VVIIIIIIINFEVKTYELTSSFSAV